MSAVRDYYANSAWYDYDNFYQFGIDQDDAEACVADLVKDCFIYVHQKDASQSANFFYEVMTCFLPYQEYDFPKLFKIIETYSTLDQKAVKDYIVAKLSKTLTFKFENHFNQ